MRVTPQNRKIVDLKPTFIATCTAVPTILIDFKLFIRNIAWGRLAPILMKETY